MGFALQLHIAVLNRMALTFFITDNYGNPVQPVFVGKVHLNCHP